MISYPKTAAPGFTLTEVLVVLAIIAVLAVLMFQVTGTIRERSRKANDIGNLRAIAVGLASYSTENGGFYPYLRKGDPDGNGMNWTSTVSPYLDKEIVSGGGGISRLAGSFKSPMYAQHHTEGDYGANHFLLPESFMKRPHLSTVENPSKTILVSNSGSPSRQTKAGLPFPSWVLNARAALGVVAGGDRPLPIYSDNTFNAGFVDGHVESIDFADFERSKEKFLGSQPPQR